MRLKSVPGRREGGQFEAPGPLASQMMHPGEIALGLVLAWLAVTVTVTDLDRRIIPNRVLGIASLLCLAIAAVAEPASIPERTAAALGGGSALFIPALACPEGMGMGDVKLAATVGLFLGVAVVPALLIGLVAGMVVGVATRRRTIPLGPFLALGAVISFLFGDALLAAYAAALQ